MNLQPISFRSDGLALSGTLTMPRIATPAPCVVMVHGSGPQDRDGNIKGFRTDILRYIAEHLAAQGIASLRYDKRGCGQSEGHFGTAGLLEMVGDAQAAVACAARQPGICPDRIFVLGHSEGAVLCPDICAGGAFTRGAIMLCASLRSLEEDLIKNAEVLNRDLKTLKGLKGRLARWLFYTKDPQAVVASLRQRVENTRRRRMWVSFQRVSTKFYRDTFNYNVRQHLVTFRKPILAIGGGKDFQCLPEDTLEIAELSQGPVITRIMPDMNHMLRNQQEEPTMLNYKAQSDEPVLDEVPRTVAHWVAGFAPLQARGDGGADHGGPSPSAP
ncbi:alpha/beta fold hydrolase [Roseinatronobacter sp. HJB301]|uniref:Alpha/beta fold hydrolase n=1 Tax=Roseinatronobacter alkalisoli TaxID=3028235 RepID=A0ABT5T6X2_9RHOB|nr:alpha/beta fold hydrolase [Roseinatronobacter sp. HJB301]